MVSEEKGKKRPNNNPELKISPWGKKTPKKKKKGKEGK